MITSPGWSLPTVCRQKNRATVRDSHPAVSFSAASGRLAELPAGKAADDDVLANGGDRLLQQV